MYPESNELTSAASACPEYNMEITKLNMCVYF